MFFGIGSDQYGFTIQQASGRRARKFDCEVSESVETKQRKGQETSETKEG